MKGDAVRDSIDILTVLTTIATLFFTPAMAAIIAPYSVIIIASTLGAAWALGRRDPESRPKALFFYLRINFLAILFTVTGCNILETFVFHREIKWLLAPVAFAIGWIGDDWPKIITWLGVLIKRKAKRAVIQWANERDSKHDDV